MNSVKVSVYKKKSICKNPLLFYTLTTNNQKQKLMKQFYLEQHHKIFRHKFNQEVKEFHAENNKVFMKETEEDANK